MRLRAIACLPCVAAQPFVIDISESSRIIHLPFSEWLDLEGQSRSAQYDKLERGYSKNPPVFWEKVIEADSSLIINRNPENVIALTDSIEPELEALLKALHWYTGIAPINPMRSVIYFDPRSEQNLAMFRDLELVIAEHGVQRRYGESEKEYATQNVTPTISLRQIDSAQFARMVTFARQTQMVWMGEQFELAAQSLSLCASPGLDWPSRIVLLVGSCESLFLPDGHDMVGELQKNFEKRLSCLAAERYEEVTRYADSLKLAYQLRSDLVHGRTLTKSLKKLPEPPEDFVNNFSRVVVLALCKLIRYRYAHPAVEGKLDPLWSVLDSASQREGFDVLQTLIPSVSAISFSHQWQVEERSC